MTEKRLNVLFISSWYPSRVNNLLGIFVKRHAAAVARFCNVSVIYVCSDEHEGVEESMEDNVYTLRVYYKKVSSAVPIYSQWLKWRSYINAWKKAIQIYEAKKGKPDIINANVVFPVSAIAIKLKAKWKVPFVITEHWTGYFPEDGRYKGMMVEKISKAGVREASGIITVSESLKKQMLSLGLTNTYSVIPNIVDEKLFTISTIKHDAAKAFNFIHISGLDNDQKNVNGIIKVFAKVHTGVPATTLTIVGNGAGISDLKTLAKSLNLESSVTFTGTKTGTDLVALVQYADAFVLFSNYENLPCVMLEAMCCGLPVISATVGDIPAYINDANGLLIDAGNENELVRAMEQMIKKRGDYNSEVIRNTVIDKVNADVIGKQFVEVYNKVLQK
jgi:glycosyltransferase involved in cell wall biosynthesis